MLRGCAFSTSESVETEEVIPRGYRLTVVLLRVIFLPIIFLPIIFLPILGWSWQEDGWQKNGVARQVEWERSLFWGRLAIRDPRTLGRKKCLGAVHLLRPSLQSWVCGVFASVLIFVFPLVDFSALIAPLR